MLEVSVIDIVWFQEIEARIIPLLLDNSGLKLFPCIIHTLMSISVADQWTAYIVMKLY